MSRHSQTNAEAHWGVTGATWRQIDLLFLIPVSDGLFMWTGEAPLPKIDLRGRFRALLGLSLAWRSSCADLGFDSEAGTEFPRTWLVPVAASWWGCPRGERLKP